VNIGADDDDGNKASLPKQAEPQAQKDVMADWVKSINGCKTENDLQALWHGSGLTTSTAGAALIALFDRRKKEINGTK
jgi:hypothetical protein